MTGQGVVNREVVIQPRRLGGEEGVILHVEELGEWDDDKARLKWSSPCGKQ